MAAPKGIKAVAWLARRTKEQRGGNAPQPDGFDRSAPDGLALWRDAYLESLRVRNYSPETIEGRVFALKFFLAWSAERDLKLASQITRPILEAYQRSLSPLHAAQRAVRSAGPRSGENSARSRTSSGG
jgi:hypothetical protein